MGETAIDLPILFAEVDSKLELSRDEDLANPPVDRLFQ
jgi:hypothetical protein